ncbi:MAG: Nif3-like dinuclear metal center hexameric protein [Thermodesulfobacteriota bacterium]|nr:Nif3-like dinuclear metal center hexameric protein [Thermodesulfobacteriota bacterium]
MELKKITDYLDDYLAIDTFRDDSTNGLQVENGGAVKKIGLAVDACHEAIVKAGDAGCNLLVVHHGLFWGKQELLRGYFYKRISALIKADIALYAVHLPLDGHPEVGHNIQIAKKMGLQNIEPFAYYYEKPIGVKGTLQETQPLSEVSKNIETVIGRCRALLEFGPDKITSIGIVSGSATEPHLFRELKLQGIDLFISGEPKHGAYYLAQEMGLNIFYGGHYLTETYGMKALRDHLESALNIPAEFIDAPCIF